MPRRPPADLDYFFGRDERAVPACKITEDTGRSWTWTSSGHSVSTEIPSWNHLTKPLCLNCLDEMSKPATCRNLFHYEPCREIIQFFGVGRDPSDVGPHDCPSAASATVTAPAPSELRR
jgi:hypothetical protein